MKKLSVALALMAAGFLTVSLVGMSYAQDKPEMEVPSVETEYSTGMVVSVDETLNQIVVREYDYNQDQEVEVTYTVNQETTFEDVASLKDIAAGDSIEIEFVSENGAKIAKMVTIEKMADEGGVNMTPQDEVGNDAPGSDTTSAPSGDMQ
jgi:hypothetical protein